MVKADQGKPRLYWLPKVFAAYAKPVAVSWPKRKHKKKQSLRVKLKKLKLVSRVIAAIRLQKLFFDFLMFRPVQSKFVVECIISLRLSDIILKAIRRQWRKIRRRY